MACWLSSWGALNRTQEYSIHGQPGGLNGNLAGGSTYAAGANITSSRAAALNIPGAPQVDSVAHCHKKSAARSQNQTVVCGHGIPSSAEEGSFPSSFESQ
jgi:hypothetical protein